jgi:hypothetical protein
MIFKTFDRKREGLQTFDKFCWLFVGEQVGGGGCNEHERHVEEREGGTEGGKIIFAPP